MRRRQKIKTRHDAMSFVGKQLYGSDDETIVVLRAHLIVETLLLRYLERRLPNSGALSDARLTFTQLVSLAAALQSRERNGRLWEVLKKLNSLRNELAHELDDKHYVQLRADFLESTRGFIDSGKTSEKERLRTALNILCALVYNLPKSA